MTVVFPAGVCEESTHAHWNDPIEDGRPWEARDPDADARIIDWLAMVILFGLFTSTTLNMVVVPSVYYAAGRPRSNA